MPSLPVLILLLSVLCAPRAAAQDAARSAAYMTGVTSYFNHPTALNRSEPVGLGQAIGIRVFGLVVNAFLNGIAGALGWALGALLPRHSPRQ